MLSKYLNSKPKDKTLLEPGCGNGWLSNKLAGLGFSEVIGLDVNITELEQAARVFSGKDNLIFVYGDIFSLPLSGGDRRTYGASEGGLDFIILSSVIAYFKDLNALINSLLNKLNANGEIHIIDSPFYKNTSAARERSIKYYTELGLPEMAELYYHYSLDDLKGYNHSILYDPDTLVNKIKRKLNASLPPFYRVKITK
jgi:SAM-dependent methyltransferase